MRNPNKRLAVIIVALLMISVGRSAGQDEALLPQQSSQRYSPGYGSSPGVVPPTPHSAQESDVRTLPQIAPQLPSPGANEPALATQPTAAQPTLRSKPVYQSQPTLPAVFRGCWEGRVEYLDSVERLPGGAKLGFWTPKTYRLCYRRIGNGPFVLTFTEAGIEENDRITNAQGRMTLLSSDGRHYASMRSDLNFDEFPVRADSLKADTFSVHEVAELDCRIEADGMHVKGIVTGWRDGVPWFRARWHTILIHQSVPPEQVEAPPGGVPE